LILIGLTFQFYVSSISTANLEYIDQQKQEYLETDAKVANAFTDLITRTNDLVEIQLQDYLSGLLQNTEPPQLEVLGTFQDDFNDLLNLLRRRNNTGYFINESLIRQIPVVYEANSSRLQEIDLLIKGGVEGTFGGVSQIQLSVNNVIFIAQTETNNLKNRYIEASSDYFEIFDAYYDSISQVSELIDDLGDLILADTDLPLIQAAFAIVEEMEEVVSDLNDVLAAVSRYMQTVDAGIEDYDDIALEVAANMTDIQNVMYSHFNDMEALALDASQIDALNDTALLFNATFPVDSNPFADAVDDYADIRNEVANYATSQFVLSLENTQQTLIEAKNQYDIEHAAFIGQFNALESELIGSSQLLTLFTTLFIGVIVLILAIPTILRINNSTRRLNRNMSRVAEGDLSFDLKEINSNDEFDLIEGNFNNLVGNLRNVMGVVQQSSTQLAGISEELAAGTEEASASLNTVSQSVSSITKGAIQQNLLLERLQSKMNELRLEIQKISLQIEDASGQVHNLSQRTNILGLNASISAAKAGKFARGFGIVSEEIRELANSSKESSALISDLVDEIVIRLRQLSGEMITNINQVKQVAETTAEGSEQTNSTTEEQVIMLSEINETSNDLANLANNLDQVLSRFILEK
jgi:methyl-accepting chemotaxis protein